MSEPKMMTLRVQSAEGTARVQLAADAATAVLFERVHEELRLSSFAFTLHADRARRREILSSKSRTLRDLGLQHGDLLYLSPINGAMIFDQPSTSSQAVTTPNSALMEAGPSSAALATPRTTASAKPAAVQEDDVDLILYKMSGNIQRQRDDKLCRHNSNGCCVHCAPLEPWDENYLKEHNIKHMSFHSYLRKMTSGKFVSLEELSFKIKPGCTEHPPWPRGICSGCQPGAVTLNRQRWRLVDNILFESAAVVDRFLRYWRSTAHQRAGWLYGRYEPHDGVPLGIRARVSAIYEPPQSTGRDHLSLESDPKEPLVEQIAARLGLRRVGWLFTDLLRDEQPQRVRHLRGADTHFLSAQECITAGHFQNQHPNPCRAAPSGYYGSKFVTVCITGDSNQQIHMEGYQVSEQCQALVRDDILLPTRDAPDLGYIRRASDQRYVPTVYYKEKDSYGNEVPVAASTVPVAYLLVDVPCGAAAAAAAPAADADAAMPPAHRPLQDQLQSLQAFHRHCEAAKDFLEAMSDLHVLVWLATNDTLPLSLEELAPLLAAVRAGDAAAAEAWRDATPALHTLQHLARHQHDSQSEGLGGGGAGGAEGAGGVWTCPHCTFHNAPAAAACDMCALPRGNAM